MAEERPTLAFQTNQSQYVNEVEKIKRRFREATTELRRKHEIRGFYLAHQAIQAAEQCFGIGLEENLLLQSMISGEYLNAGLQHEASELDLKIERSLEGLHDAECRTALQNTLFLRRNKYERLITGIDPSQSINSAHSATNRDGLQQPSHSAPEDRQLRHDTLRRNTTNTSSTLDLMDDWRSPRSDSHLSRPRSLSPVTKSEVAQTTQRSRSRPTTATREAILPWYGASSGSEPDLVIIDSKAKAASIRRNGYDWTQTKVQSSQFASNNLDTYEGKADEWFNCLSHKTHNFIRGPDDRFQSEAYERVRVAVLDTGFSNKNLSERTLTQSFSGKISKFYSFIAGEKHGDGDIDGGGHGTDVLFQLSRVCPNAKLYSYRVARRDNGKLVADKVAVLAALEQAVKDKVDIVNMSFWWPYDDEDVERALHTAQDAGILLFASVSNSGAIWDRNIFYPASSSCVIAVDAADGLGDPAPFNSSTSSGDIKARFTAPGMGVLGIIHPRRSGTSFASPIAAGIAALVLEFARQTPLAGDNASIFLQKREGMELILKKMQVQKTPDPFLFLKPWGLLVDHSGRAGGSGGPGSRRYYVASDVVEELRRKYGYDRGIGDNFINT
ncbi:subtilisin-like protein [Pleomassaria siparia CBS 279.74]|uniref:Subtilisin-like protein n=1 Tax=Pleomassaria siparia CBS 279.74 TaxID=1314801 RepID=A0A6G1JQK3_9PLEO|nr:subtilisin-like protein [Pleomassaria siparia CBS 279.74]